MATPEDLEKRARAVSSAAADRRAAVLERMALFGRARARAANGEKRGAVLGRIAERTRVPEVTAEPHQAVLHGRVTGSDGAGREGLVVVVLDGRRREAARVTSVEVGYFRFVFPPGEARGEATKGKGKDEVKVRLEVRDAEGAVLGRIDGVELARGKVVYVEPTAK